MIPIYEAWCCQIELTNYCGINCLYCSRYNSHLRHDQRQHMSLDQLRQALDSLRNWPGRIGIIGGEPLLHPQFKEACDLIRSMYPPQKMMLWTSGGKRWEEYKPLIKKTFKDVAYNEHNESQKETCQHQPLTVSIKEAVPAENIRKQLIDDCWVQRTWCPTITPYGAYFCEVGAAQDILLNGGENAWPITPDWWQKVPSQFQDQVVQFCDNCGMATPLEREMIKNSVEKFSPQFLELCKSKNLRRLDEKHVAIYEHSLSTEELKNNIKRWSPGNYRGDLHSDEIAPEGRGFTKELITESNLKVEVISMWYNEAFLAPFFLNHYSFADKIHIFYDQDTTDNTLEIISRYDNVNVIPFKFPDMMDDLIKVDKINGLLRTLECDWVIAVDADEFVFPLPLGRDMREALEREADYDLIYAQLWQVYRHKNDNDLTPELSTAQQRRHGDPNVTEGINAAYVKPIIVRPGAGIEWLPGCHDIVKKHGIKKILNKIRGNKIAISPRKQYGSHWAMADPEFVVERRIKGRKERQSKSNIEKKLTYHQHNITESSILEECDLHLNDPLLF